MQQFLSRLRIEDMEEENEDGRALFVLIEPFGWRSGDGWEIWVPAYFTTDFASIPFFLWSLEPPTGRARRAAVIHDWLYASGIATREIADKAFLEAMDCCGVPYLKRSAMYRAVRTFGGGGYKRPEEFEKSKWLLERSELPMPLEGVYA